MESEGELGAATHDSVDGGYVYITEGRYPAGASANHKRMIRAKAKKFAVRDGELFYKRVKRGRGSSKVRRHLYRKIATILTHFALQ